MRTVKIFFQSGDTVVTRINGTQQQIKAYYAVGTVVGFDCNDKIIRLEFID